MLLATTRFTARQVPLLRGNIVITGTDDAGDPAGLTDTQVKFLINADPTSRDEWILDWRFTRDARAQRRAARHTDETRMAAIIRAWR